MKVIQNGTGQKGWSTKAKCTGGGNGGGGCKAVLLVEQPDLYRTSSSSYDGSTDTFVTFCCPECGVETDLADNRVPSNVYSNLPTKKAWETNRGLRPDTQEK